MEGVWIAQLVTGIDNTLLFIGVLIIIIAVAWVLKKILEARSAEEDRTRGERLDYQPSVKWNPVAKPVPISWQGRKERPDAATVADTDILGTCQDLQQCLTALAGKYALESFTLATSDGLVFASSGSSTALEDAAGFGRKSGAPVPSGVTLFSMVHKGSGLTGIIRSENRISREIEKRIAEDTKDILNKWI